MLNNSIDKDRITYNAPDANSIDNNQPWKKPAVGSPPGPSSPSGTYA